MHYYTYPASEPLSKYVKYYWTLEGIDDSVAASRERIFPDGCMELIFHYGDLFRKYSTDIDAFDQPRSFLHGQLKRFMDIESTGKIGVFSIRFRPDGLHAFIEMDLNELTGNAVSIRDLWGADGCILEEKMLEATTTAQRINIIEQFLIRQMKWRTDNSIHYCVRSIVNSEGSKSIELLSREVNLGRRQLERKFIATVGLSPKLLTRIIRFQNTLHRLEAKQLASLTGVAYSGGFYDQSHFIKDFKEFTGLNPKQYFTADLEFAKYLTAG